MNKAIVCMFLFILSVAIVFAHEHEISLDELEPDQIIPEGSVLHLPANSPGGENLGVDVALEGGRYELSNGRIMDVPDNFQARILSDGSFEFDNPTPETMTISNYEQVTVTGDGNPYTIEISAPRNRRPFDPDSLKSLNGAMRALINDLYDSATYEEPIPFAIIDGKPFLGVNEITRNLDGSYTGRLVEGPAHIGGLNLEMLDLSGRNLRAELRPTFQLFPERDPPRIEFGVKDTFWESSFVPQIKGISEDLAELELGGDFRVGDEWAVRSSAVRYSRDGILNMLPDEEVMVSGYTFRTEGEAVTPILLGDQELATSNGDGPAIRLARASPNDPPAIIEGNNVQHRVQFTDHMFVRAGEHPVVVNMDDETVRISNGLLLLGIETESRDSLLSDLVTTGATATYEYDPHQFDVEGVVMEVRGENAEGFYDRGAGDGSVGIRRGGELVVYSPTRGDSPAQLNMNDNRGDVDFRWIANTEGDPDVISGGPGRVARVRLGRHKDI